MIDLTVYTTCELAMMIGDTVGHVDDDNAPGATRELVDRMRAEMEARPDYEWWLGIQAATAGL